MEEAMSVQQELTVEQEIRQQGLRDALDMFKHHEELKVTTRNILLAAQSFAEFVKNDAVPFEVDTAEGDITTTTTTNTAVTSSKSSS
jgi:hypothetical protein